MCCVPLADMLLQSIPEQDDAHEPLPALFEDQEDANSPPEPTLSLRAKSYSDFYDIVKAQLSSPGPKKKRKRRRSGRTWEALALPESATASLPVEEEEDGDALDKALLQASQQEYLLYHDELAMTERHLGTLITDADNALKVLESLCQSFRAVDEQTSSFQAQCDGLLTEQKRLETLADAVGTDLQYYTYLDSATRRLNAPGAGRLVEGGSFAEILSTLDSCIEFMTRNVSVLSRRRGLRADTHSLHTATPSRTSRATRPCSPRHCTCSRWASSTT